ncbi:MAG TPA: NapC/NirT family cytochrome c [Candidatus Hydrogenedentes bacterium]|nr:NapC/NirT family cytochrome c [Candidatus Hydrogenedentota bacterium]
MHHRKSPWLSALMTLFGRNVITLLGGTIASATGLVIVGLLVVTLLQITESPYISIMTFLVLPAVFVMGLLLVPIGAYWDKRRAARQGVSRDDASREAYPVIDLNKAHTRRVAGLFVAITAVNLLIISIVSYEGVEYMDSPEFCGTVCHTVMEPEYTAYVRSPHARVSCADCHIGPGAPWFVQAKISGLRQVLAVFAHTYETPIPAPVRNLRPSQDTCEQCHWPEKFTGDRLKVTASFSPDEANSPTSTVLLLHIGGGSAGRGIHSWHIDPDRKTTYVAEDSSRKKILSVRVQEKDGRVTEYLAGGAPLTPEQAAQSETRAMDCIDCHNRPTHVFQMPGPAMDEGLASGRIDVSLPFIKKIGVEALEAATGKPGDADAIARTVRTYYEQQYGEIAAAKPESIEGAIREIQAIYRANVFPKMKVTWGVYSDNIRGGDHAGCYRCHDDDHTSADGRKIRQDCDLCHKVLAWDEANPEVLTQLGIAQP